MLVTKKSENVFNGGRKSSLRTDNAPENLHGVTMPFAGWGNSDQQTSYNPGPTPHVKTQEDAATATTWTV